MKIRVALLALAICAPVFAVPAEAFAKIPVIYDTDIGGDIDDTWALALILASPELDLKMVVTDSHDTTGRAKIAAKFLETAGRGDVPIGIGTPEGGGAGPQYKWAEDYDLDNYPGEIHKDGVGAMIEMIRSSEEPITLFVVGPCPNIEEMLRRAPDTADRVKEVFAMSGSVHKGYGGSATPDAEYNVRDNVSASQAMYKADWKLTIAPLDTAGLVVLQGEKYQKLLQNPNPLIDALIANYRVWAEEGNHSIPVDTRSSTLFDCVAIYLAYDQSLCVMEEHPIKVDDKGYTVIDPDANKIMAAMDWKDLGAFEDMLVERLIQGVQKPDESE